ncbi:DciA family protein [uncultured Aquitalea sp.]|uniref:DciA family protein n=1 Tax=uncultured Aquitalea sp. TaxID=540272 RepID=UPI0025FA6029|nr:DciA family protein [uncultured Aquitalea sp.]
MSERQFSDIARQDGNLSRLTSEARALMALDRAFRQLLPGNLADCCRAVRIRDDELVVFANSGIVAARLRMLGNSLLPPLAAKGYVASSMRVKVDIRLTPPPRPAKRIAISTAALDTMSAAIDSVGNADVKQALASLIAKHRRQAQD